MITRFLITFRVKSKSLTLVHEDTKAVALGPVRHLISCSHPASSPNTHSLFVLHASLRGFPHTHHFTPPRSSLRLLLLHSLAPTCRPGGFSSSVSARWKRQPLAGLPLIAWSEEAVLYCIVLCHFPVNNHAFKDTPVCSVPHLCSRAGNAHSTHAGT